MKVNVDRFFLKSNEVGDIPDSYYEKITPVIDAVKAFARNTNQCIYIIDYAKKNFMYVSPNLKQLCGGDAADMLTSGYEFHTRYVPFEDQKMLIELNKKGFDFYNDIPVNERDGYSISYDFRLQKGGHQQMLHHTLTSLVTTRKGRVWIALCTMSLSSSREAGNIIMRKEGSRTIHKYDLASHAWIEQKLPKPLNPVEHLILTMSMQGYTMEEISTLKQISINTLKSSKRILFDKLNVKSIAEAITFCINYKLL